MTEINRNIGAFILVCLGCFLVFHVSYGNILYRLNEIQLDMGGDGLKNYYTFAYQTLYGSGMQFNGMLFPYGELAIFADAQPLLVWILQLCMWLGIQFDDHLLLIINVLPLLGFGIGGYFLYKILVHYKVKWGPAILFGVVGVMISPQVIRLQSHYALSYAFVIPLFWYGWLKWELSNQWRYFLLLCGFSFSMGFIHPYFVLMLSVLSFTQWISHSIIFREMKWNYLLLSIVPVFAFFLVVKGIDPIVDRPENPYGMLVYRTLPIDILPIHGWLSKLLGNLISLRENYAEGYSYPGAMLLFLPVIILIRYVYVKFYNLKNASLNHDSSLLRDGVSALIVLFVGMGLHVVLTNGLILELLPPLKQFRSLGRLSWIFYYISFVFLAVYFMRLVQRVKPLVRNFLVVFIVLLFCNEIYTFHSKFGENIKKYSSGNLLIENTVIKDLLENRGISPESFQAVLSLPISAEGAEKITFKDDWQTRVHLLPFSFQTGLPLTQSIMSRISLSRILKILQLSSSQYIKKEVIEDFPNEKDLLVVLENRRKQLFLDILDKASFIDSTDKISLFRLKLTDLKQQQFLDPASLNNFIQMTNVNSINQASAKDGIFYIYRDFEEGDGPMGLLSKHAGLIDNEKGELIFSENIDLKSSLEVELSIWYKIQPAKTNVPHFKFIQYGVNHKVEKEDIFRDWDLHRVEVYKNWIRLQRKYELTETTNKVELLAFGKHINIDNVLLSPISSKSFAYTQDPSIVFLNHSLVELLPQNADK